MRKKDSSLSFFMLKWHKALKTFRSGCKSRWPSQSFLAPAFPTPTACAIRNTNQRAEGREEEWVYRKVFEGVGWVHRLFTNGVTRPPRPHPRTGDSPSVGLGREVTHSGELTRAVVGRFRSVRGGELAGSKGRRRIPDPRLTCTEPRHRAPDPSPPTPLLESHWLPQACRSTRAKYPPLGVAVLPVSQWKRGRALPGFGGGGPGGQAPKKPVSWNCSIRPVTSLMLRDHNVLSQG